MILNLEKMNIKNVLRSITIAFTIISIFLAINQVFNLRFFCNVVLFGKTYNFLLLGLLLPLVFLSDKLKKEKKYLGFNILAFFILCISCMYFAWKGYEIVIKGYGYFAPINMVILAIFVWILIIESVRKSAGSVLTIVILFFSLYPVFAEHMPGLFQGIGRSFSKTAVFHILSSESATGTLLDVFSSTLMGYLIFGEAMVFTGGADFLLNITKKFVGRTRGGTAKISVIASALFGSISGSSIANVITTGSITIPAMKESGYKAHYAGAIEACASTAGTLTPPIMGATAFVMASFINVPYNVVALGAAIPAILFYIALFIQVDGNAAKRGVKINQKKETLSFLDVLKDGWFYLPTLAILVYFLFVLQLVNEAPYVATILMLALAQIRKKSRLSLKQFLKLFNRTGKNMASLLAILIGVGFLLGSFSLTGIASTFARELFLLAGKSIPLMLVITAIASLIMGMGMTTIACYIFLSLVIAPGLVGAGLNELAAHLFILYCGMLAYITPPVALTAIVAANIADASPMKIAMTACRLGGAIFIVPFFFVLDPALVMQGEPVHIICKFITTALAMGILGSALEGYLMGIGNIESDYLVRGILVISSIGLAFPGDWKINLIGGLIILLTIFTNSLIRKRKAIAI